MICSMVAEGTGDHQIIEYNIVGICARSNETLPVLIPTHITLLLTKLAQTVQASM